MQPPPGYPQQPQGQPQGQPYPQGPQPAPGYGAPQQGYAPQYGMQQPYYPPQKKGMPGWAWGLIIGAIVLFCGFPLLGILLLPMMTSNTNEARRAEGEQLMGSARDASRVQYSKTGSVPTTISSFTSLWDFQGVYYNVDDSIRNLGGGGGGGYGGGYGSSDSGKAEITCSPTTSSPDSDRGHMEFQWSSGNSVVRWD